MPASNGTPVVDTVLASETVPTPGATGGEISNPTKFNIDGAAECTSCAGVTEAEFGKPLRATHTVCNCVSDGNRLTQTVRKRHLRPNCLAASALRFSFS